ncbi:response regulator [Actinoplanes sp. NPDC049265]|uniref:response regulator n=1 Tax=Actinoplanes sp. NPDC049265 TaxID=3363902 RepID=UPI003719B089
MESARPGLTVLLVDDHPLVRQGLASMLERESWVGRVAEAATVREGEHAAVLERPDLAVVDLGLPDGTGLDLIRRIRQAAPDCAILVLTMTRDDHLVRDCLAAGASGYVLKDTAPPAVVNALRAVADHGVVLGPQVTADPPEALPAPLNRLLPRDVRLLALVADGQTNAQIARKLGLAEKTVRNRFTRILAVLGAADRVQAVLLAREKGLTIGHPAAR